VRFQEIPMPRCRSFAESLLRLLVACLLTSTSIAPAVFAQEGLSVGVAGGKTSRIQRVSSPPVIDGRLDEADWLRAPVIADLHQVNPVELAPPSEETRVYVLYDRDAIYFGARMFDSEPERINALILRQGQQIGSDDRFFVHIDSFANRRSGYLFGVNPNGVRYDGIFENITQRSFDWDGIWRAAATIDEQGWSVEIAIPFKTLSFDPRNTTWRMNFMRNIARKNEFIAWESRNRNTDLSTMGEVRGISQVDQGVGLDVVPSLSVRERKDYVGTASDSDTHPSLDVFYKITPSLNGSLTINTDFSATEVDARQVNLTRFSLFFPERRDFFLQDVDIFQFGRLEQDGRPFFSRTIGLSATGQEVPIDYGGKISGRIGRFDIGTLAIRQEPFGTVDAADLFVGRVAANVLEESSLGMIVTNGDPASNLDNSAAGIDFRFLNSRLRRGRGIEGEAWVQQTDTEGVTGDDGAYGFGVRFPNTTGFSGGFDTMELQANFNPALGFVRRTGVRSYNLAFGDTLRPEGGKIRTIYSGVDAGRIEFLDNGEVQSAALRINVVDVNLNSQDAFGAGYTFAEEGLRQPFPIHPSHTIPPGVYKFEYANLAVRTGDQRKVGAGVFVNDGGFYDGEQLGVGGFLGWRPNKHFRTNINYQYNDIHFGATRFITRLIRLQLDAVFSSTLSWTNLIQYDNQSETIGFNSRLHWIPEAGREGYLVLNHNLQDLDKNNTFHTSFNELTIKYSYTFRF
jgi:hypothetical protein